ncbi:MAG: hypothetical protein LUD50_00170 [Clostridia bacterium]|nr:hypothetical protein [Clostridia bacterium]
MSTVLQGEVKLTKLTEEEKANFISLRHEHEQLAIRVRLEETQHCPICGAEMTVGSTTLRKCWMYVDTDLEKKNDVAHILHLNTEDENAFDAYCKERSGFVEKKNVTFVIPVCHCPECAKKNKEKQKDEKKGQTNHRILLPCMQPNSTNGLLVLVNTAKGSTEYFTDSEIRAAKGRVDTLMQQRALGQGYEISDKGSGADVGNKIDAAIVAAFQPQATIAVQNEEESEEPITYKSWDEFPYSGNEGWTVWHRVENLLTLLMEVIRRWLQKTFLKRTCSI